MKEQQVADTRGSIPVPSGDRVEESENARLRAEIDRLSGTVIEPAAELAPLRGQAAWG